MKTVPEQLTGNISQTKLAFQRGVFRVGSDIAVTLSLFYLAWQSGAWQLFTMAGVALILVIVGIVGLRFIRRGYLQLGVWIIIAGLWPTFLICALLIGGLGLLLAITVVILTAIVASQTLPQQQAKRAYIASIGVGIGTFLLDRFTLSYRLPVPNEFFWVIVVVVGLLLLVYGYFTLRDFANYSLRVKLILAFLMVAIISVGLLAVVNYWNTRQLLTNTANQSLSAAAAEIATSIDDFILTNLDSVRVEAQLPAIVNYLSLPIGQREGSTAEAEALATLRALSRKGSVFISSYALLDSNGQDVLDTYTPDIGLDKSDRDYFLTPQQTGESYVSSVRLSPTVNEPSIYFSSLVRNHTGEFIGILLVRYDAAAFQQIITLHNALAGPRSFAILLDENYIYLAHGSASHLILKSVGLLEQNRLMQLQANGFLPAGSAEQLSTNAFEFEQALANITPNQPYITVPIGETTPDNDLEQAAVVQLKTQPWQVIFAQPQEVFLTPIEDQTRTSFFVAIIIAGVVAVIAVILGQFLARPITRLTAVAQQVTTGNLRAQASIESHDEIGQLAQAFNEMTAQLRSLIGSLEDQVRERTADLALSIEVGQRALAIRELDNLLPTITEFIRAQFNLYYIQVYFVDDLGKNLVLKAGTGKAGKELLLRRHTLRVGMGIVGRVAAEHKSIVVPDTQNSDIHRPNPLLSNTRSELAIPLIVEDRVIGVLDMQADKINTFTEDNMTVFEAMATQLAISIDSAQQWALAQEAQHKSEEIVRQLTRQGWAERLASHQENLGFAYDLSTVAPLSKVEMVHDATKITVPLMVQNECIGQLAVALPPQRSLSRDEQGLLAAVAQQLSQKAENLRLFEKTQQRAAREQIARQIVDKVRASRDIEQALKTATEELAKSLGVARAVVNLQVDPTDKPHHETTNE